LDEAAGESQALPMHFQSTGGASRNALTRSLSSWELLAGLLSASRRRNLPRVGAPHQRFRVGKYTATGCL